ncbi:hypothetical protein GQ457_08G001020 [Hibiscus cannabinus]
MLGFGNQVKVPLVSNIDSATVVINDIAKWRTLPQKGKLLQAVTEAGPLLQTLILSGPLPCWRNPPPLQAFKIPSVSLKGLCDSRVDDFKLLANPNINFTQKHVNHCSGSMLNFASSCFNSSQMLNTVVAGVNPSITLVKRPKFNFASKGEVFVNCYKSWPSSANSYSVWSSSLLEEPSSIVGF